MERVKITYDSLTFVVLLSIGIVALYMARYVVVIGLIGIGLGVLYVPLLRILRIKFHLPKSLAALTVLLCIIILGAVIFGSIYYLVSDQISSLVERAPSIIDSVDSRLAELFNKFPWLKTHIQEMRFKNSIQQGLIKLLSGFKMFFVIISGGILVLFLSLYAAVDGSYLYNSLVGAFKPHYREKAGAVLKDCAEVVRGWFKAQLLDMVIIGILTGLSLWALGIEYWAVFGLLTAVLGIIPYVGIIIVVLTVTLITLASDPSKVPWVIVIYIVTQQLEGNLILPLVMKGKADLPIVPLLLFMLLLGTFVGVLGVFIASPLLAVLRTLYIDLYLPKINGEPVTN